MPVKPASPMPRSVRRTSRPAKDVDTDCREAVMPQDKTMIVTYICGGTIFHNTLIHSKQIYAM